MTDAVGGVDVVVTRTTTDPEHHITFRAGVNHLDGNAALLYVRQRKALPHGDFDREKRQQQFIRALLKKATETGTLTNPAKLNALLTATSDAVVADKDLSVGKAVVQFRHLRTKDLTFITTPNLGAQTINGASVVPLDRPKALALFTAVNDDTVDQWLKTNPANDVTSGF
jgi:anionic cell wall polymer biosynthesis LytR-Cps2A-Psr (LCP) family protein